TRAPGRMANTRANWSSAWNQSRSVNFGFGGRPTYGVGSVKGISLMGAFDFNARHESGDRPHSGNACAAPADRRLLRRAPRSLGSDLHRHLPAACRWLSKRAKSIVCIGDSAGGNLVAALLVKLRDAGEALPGAAVLISPVLDLALTGASVAERAARDAVILPESLRMCSSAYLGG